MRAGEVVTVGNHSYVHLDLGGESREHVQEILQALDDFEKMHRNLEITGWHLDKQQEAWLTALDRVFGIWVDHRPRC